MSARKSTKTLTVAMVSALFAVSAGIAAAADTGLTPGDRDFVNKAAQGNSMEVAAGKLAQQRALDPTVKHFGAQMVSDHTAANEALKTVADSKQMPLGDTLPQEEQDALGKLESLNGTEFDKAYAKMMMEDHKKDVSEFEKETRQAKDPDVKAYAQQTLPTRKHHLMMANRLNAAEKKSP
jgi:putative membrane protein